MWSRRGSSSRRGPCSRHQGGGEAQLGQQHEQLVGPGRGHGTAPPAGEDAQVVMQLVVAAFRKVVAAADTGDAAAAAGVLLTAAAAAAAASPPAASAKVAAAANKLRLSPLPGSASQLKGVAGTGTMGRSAGVPDGSEPDDSSGSPGASSADGSGRPAKRRRVGEGHATPDAPATPETAAPGPGLHGGQLPGQQQLQTSSRPPQQEQEVGQRDAAQTPRRSPPPPAARVAAASVCFHLPPPRGGAALPTQCRVLFSKQLSASDVGKMGRIIVPRACGERWKGSGMVLLLDGGPSHALLLHTPQLHLYCHVHTHPPPSNLPRPPKPHSLLLHLQPSSTCRTVPPARM